MKVFVKGLNSCGMRRTNVRRYEDFIKANGHTLVSHPNQSDVSLLWTCAFRGDMRDNSLLEIRRYLNEYQTTLVVVGCLPDIDREMLEDEFRGRFIAWRGDESEMESFFGSTTKLYDVAAVYGELPLCDDVEQYKKDNPDKDATFVDQFVKLFTSEGCNFHCTYCAEILAFPPYRSFPIENLVNACRQLIEESGRTQVMLLGDCIGDYGCDIGLTLPGLLEELKKIHSQITFGLQGFNPANFVQYFDEITQLIQQGDIFHMQIPIQSASDHILKRMNRPYAKSDILRVFDFLEQVNFNAIDTHILIGFPGETEEDFEETMDFLLQYQPHYVLASRYMESAAMPAFELSGKIDPNVQLRRLQSAGERIRAAGIICNTDDSDLSAARCRTMNHVD